MNREGIAYAVEVERVSGRLERMLSSRLLGDGDDILGLLRLLGLALQRLRYGNVWQVRLIRMDGPGSAIIEERRTTGRRLADELGYRMLEQVKNYESGR